MNFALILFVLTVLTGVLWVLAGPTLWLLTGNRELALAQLLALLQSVTKTPKKRLATKPSYSSQQKRLQSKKQQGQTKALRQQKRFD